MSANTKINTKPKWTNPNKKWDKLGVELENFIRSHVDQNGQITKPLSDLFKEFANNHNTTVSSTSYYYYNGGLKDRIFNADNEDSVEEKVEEEIEVEEEAEEDKGLDVDNEIKNLIEYIKDNYQIEVSDESVKMIQEMVEKAGVISTLLTINKVIEDYDKLDISFILIREAKSRL